MWNLSNYTESKNCRELPKRMECLEKQSWADNLCPSPVVTRMINLRLMRLSGQVVHVGEVKMCVGFWSENLMSRDDLEDPSIEWGNKGLIFSYCGDDCEELLLSGL
jgi:hypothetical protein